MSKKIDARKHMEMAVKVMKDSISEDRDDGKVVPYVGAVLVDAEDNFVEKAHRGELRDGDHAEYTLLDKKLRDRDLTNHILFATLEPCAPDARGKNKMCCAKRIANARISEVWVGIEDPDPDVDRKGIKYLENYGIETEMFDPDLQKEIRTVNKKFLEGAEDRAENEEEKIVLSEKEKVEPNADLNDLSRTEVESFLKKSRLDTEFGTPEFKRAFQQLGLLEESEEKLKPTGIGLLLFGKNPQLIYQNALIRATYKTAGRGEDIETIEGSLPNQVDKIQGWYETKIGRQIDRSQVERQVIYDYPLNVFREAIINAVVHRDYDIEGAPIYFEINDDAIIVKSPGKPLPQIKMEQIKNFNAPSLSRNPKIMYVFDQLGLVEQRGLGFQTMKDLPEKHDLPLPIISFDDPYIVMTFPRSLKSISEVSGIKELKELNEEELKGYEFIRPKQKITKREYADHFEYSDRQAERHLKKFTELDLIEKKGAGPSTHYKIIPT